MTETKVIYKEASKETIENLIGNSSKTIEDLYKKVLEDLSLLKELNADVPQLLRLAVELRMNMRFILIDLMTSLRGSLNGAYTFEKCYHIKNLYVLHRLSSLFSIALTPYHKELLPLHIPEHTYSFRIFGILV